jgi:GntR family transcriptional regulator
MFSVDANDPTPLFAQLMRSIRAAIAAGKLRIGDRLPTVRQLALDLRINPNTVAKVYSELERAGVLTARRGLGTFVREVNGGQAEKPSAVERERALHQLTERLLGDAHAAGLTIDEIIQHLDARRTGA